MDQLQELRKPPLKVGIPLFIRELDSSKHFQEQLSKAFFARTDLLKDVEARASLREFKADDIIGSIFSNAKLIATTPLLLSAANERMNLGNPPGKPGSLGDRLNWETLLREIPSGNDLYLITRDSDYFSSFPQIAPNMFLVEEWSRKKNGFIKLFNGIKSFAKHIDETIIFASAEEAVFTESPDRSKAIDNLASSYSFSQTHAAIALLDQYTKSFSPSELESLLIIAMSNNQVGGIIGDNDVLEFYQKVRNRVPWAGNAVADRFDELFGELIPF